MVNYQKGQIYIIRSHQTENIYIGSTCSPLHKRIYDHKKHYRYWKLGKRKSYTSSYEILKYDDAYIELLEDYPCEKKKHLTKKEGEYIRSMECVNKNIPGRTDEEKKEYKKEYQEMNKEKNKKYYQEYREKNKVEIYRKQLIKVNCGCGGKYSMSHKAEHMRSNKHTAWETNAMAAQNI